MATAFAELVAITGFSVVVPLLPLYIQDLGVQGEREIRLWAGIVLSAHAFTMAVFGPIWGILGDRYGRKVMVERALFSGALLVGLMGLAQSVGQLVVLRALQGMLTGSVTAAMALVAAAVPRQRAGYALGVLQVAIYLGASAGPILGGALCDLFGYRATFWAMGALLLLAALGVTLFVREEFTHQPTAADGQGAGGAGRAQPLRRAWLQMAPVLASTALMGMLGMRLLTRLGAHLVSPVIPLFVQEMLPEGARVALITGLISGAGAAAGAAGAFWLGRLGDRLGHGKILVACAAASAVCYAPQGLVDDPVWLLLLQAGAGLAMGGLLTSVSAALAQLAPAGREGIIYGIEASMASAANAVGPLAGSALAAWLGLRLPFLFTTGVFGLATLVAARLLRRPVDQVSASQNTHLECKDTPGTE